MIPMGNTVFNNDKKDPNYSSVFHTTLINLNDDWRNTQ